MKINKHLGEHLKARRLAQLQERYLNLEFDRISTQACMSKPDCTNLEECQQAITDIEDRQGDLDRAYAAVKTMIVEQEAV